MNSTLLYYWSHIIKAIMLLLSVLLLLHGHNEPGGGFVGGLLAATAFILHALARNVASARRAVRIPPETMIALGLATSLLSGMISVWFGRPFLTGEWGTVALPLVGEVKVGTPLVFDLGVYLVVAGVVLSITFSMLEKRHAA